MSDQPQTCHFDLSWAMFYLLVPPSALQHNTFNIWSKLTCRVILLVILIDLVPSPDKTLCSTYEPTWHLESCLKCLFLPLQQDNTLNRWRKLASWVMIEICNSSTLQCNTFNVWRKLTCGVLFWNLSPLGPTKQYIHAGPYKTLHSTSFSMNKPSRAMFYMSFPYLCKPIRWIYEQSRNVTSSLYFELLSFPWKTIPRTNQRMGFRHLQFRDPTLQYLEHVIIVGILGHCYDFFHFLLPCTNRHIQHMTQLGILSHFWNIPPSTLSICWTNEVSRLTPAERRVRVIKIFCASDVTKQYVEPTKLSSQVISKIYPPLDPTRQYIQHIKPTWHLESCLKCSFPPLHIIALNIEHIMTLCQFFAPPNLHKTIHLKAEQNFYLSRSKNLPLHFQWVPCQNAFGVSKTLLRKAA